MRLEGNQALWRRRDHAADGKAEDLFAAIRTWAEKRTVEEQAIGVVGIVRGRGPVVPVRPAPANIAIVGVAGVEEIIWEAPPFFRTRTIFTRSPKLYS